MPKPAPRKSQISGEWSSDDTIVCPNCGEDHGLPEDIYGGDSHNFTCTRCNAPFQAGWLYEDWTDEDGQEHMDLIVWTRRPDQPKTGARFVRSAPIIVFDLTDCPPVRSGETLDLSKAKITA